MFIIIATAPLNDGTRGFRYNFFGYKGLVRMRKKKSRGIQLFVHTECMVAHHVWRFSWYLNKRKSQRKLSHFAG